MRVVITDATGNVGTVLLRALGSEDRVESIVGIARRRPSVRSPKTTWQGADVATDELADVFRGADAVVHLAWAIQPSHDLARSLARPSRARGASSPRRRRRACPP